MQRASPETRLVFSDQVVIRELAGESVLLDLRTGVYFGLNIVGTRAWSVFAAGASLRDVSKAIHQEFDAPAPVILEDLLRFADELLARGLCEVGDTGSDVRTPHD
jgi:hypothetical protein